jgi:hypothetical protein
VNGGILITRLARQSLEEEQSSHNDPIGLANACLNNGHHKKCKLPIRFAEFKCGDI